ncbi:MAG: Uncharacterised protein [Flavobacteriia bacterium]|nr:MAG: Uncharacterised protein [Flavobacteriia bacterium]
MMPLMGVRTSWLKMFMDCSLNIALSSARSFSSWYFRLKRAFCFAFCRFETRETAKSETHASNTIK